MKCPTCKTGRLISKIVRERAGEVYRRRYCNECPAHHTTLERVVHLNAGARAERDINARRAFNPGQWWNPDIASIDPKMRAAKRRLISQPDSQYAFGLEQNAGKAKASKRAEKVTA